MKTSPLRRLAACLLLASPAWSAGPAPSPASAIDVQKTRMTAAEIEKLPDAQLLVLQGRTISVGDLKARRKLASLPLPKRSTAPDPRFAAQLAAIQKTLASEQAARLSEERAREIAAFHAAKGGK